MRQLTEAAQVAKLVRADLKKHFPGVKASVTSSTFSMGDAVDITIKTIDGEEYAYRTNEKHKAIRREIDLFMEKYQYGHFDSMNDIYESSNRRDDIPQVKFLQIH